MTKRAKKNLIIVTAILVLLTCVCAPVFAVLLHKQTIDTVVDFGEIPVGSTEYEAVSNQNFVFKTAGDKQEFSFSVTNKCSYPVQYNFEMSMSGAAGGLESAILVYLDGEYLGVLSALISGKSTVLDNRDFLLNAAVGSGASAVYDSAPRKFTFELHNGAKGSAFEGKKFGVDIKMRARNINYQKQIFVSNIKELTKAVDDVNRGGATYKTIRVTKDITLTKALTISNTCRIDMMSGKILLGGNSLTLTSPSSAKTTVTIDSSRGVVTTSETAPNIILGVSGNANTSLDITKNAKAYAKLVSVVAYDVEASYKLLDARLAAIEGYGIPAGAATDIFGGLHYLLATRLIAPSVPANSGYTYADGVFTAAANTRTSETNFKYGNHTYEFKIIGSGDPNTIINSTLAHLTALTDTTKIPFIDFDLFLPTAIPSLNVNIEWWSDNPNILSNGGVCGDSVEGIATLVATIRINDEVITRAFTYSVLKQSNIMRWDYLVSKIGDKELSALYLLGEPNFANQPQGSYAILPVVNPAAPNGADYRLLLKMNSIGLSSLTYKLSPTFDYLSMNGTPNIVALTTPTFEKYAEIMVTGKFANEMGAPDDKYTAKIPIVIKTVDNADLHKQIVKYVQGILDRTDVLQNILDTRAANGMASERGDFYLPAKYKGFLLTYTADTLGIIKAITPATIPGGVEEGYLIQLDITKFKSEEFAVPFKLTITLDTNTEPPIIQGIAARAVAPVVPPTVADVFVVVPPALHNDSAGFPNINLFYNVKLHVIQFLGRTPGQDAGVPVINGTIDTVEQGILTNYILVRDMPYVTTLIVTTGNKPYGNAANALEYDAPSGLYYYNVDDFNDGYRPILMFANLTRLTVKNNAGGNLFSNTGTAPVVTAKEYADKFVVFLTANFSKLTWIDLVGCGLTDVWDLRQYNHLTHVDLSNNTNMLEFDWISETYSLDLSYFDIRGTAFRFYQDEGLLISLYHGYALHHTTPTQQNATYYYDRAGHNSAEAFAPKPLNADEIAVYRDLYSLAFTKRTITAKSTNLYYGCLAFANRYDYYCAAPFAEGAALVHSPYVWEIKPNTSDKLVMWPKIYDTVKPADRPQTEDAVLRITSTWANRATAVRYVRLNISYKVS